MSLESLKLLWDAQNFVVLDTETTGLGWGAEIVEIAIIDYRGNILLNSRIRPQNGIPEDAARIHGIRDKDVSDCPSWQKICGEVKDALIDRDVIIYNAKYDVEMLQSSDMVCGLKNGWISIAHYECAMLGYAEFRGDWNHYHRNYRWHKLTEAISQMGLPPIHAHSALGDCQMTLSLMNHIFGDHS